MSAVLTDDRSLSFLDLYWHHIAPRKLITSQVSLFRLAIGTFTLTNVSFQSPIAQLIL
jgi:hypothetical protein